MAKLGLIATLAALVVLCMCLPSAEAFGMDAPTMHFSPVLNDFFKEAMDSHSMTMLEKVVMKLAKRAQSALDWLPKERHYLWMSEEVSFDPLFLPAPYYRYIPMYVTSIVNDTKAEWSAPCFKKNVASVSISDKKEPVLTIEVSEPSSLLCSDFYMISTMESSYMKLFFFQGKHKLDWKLNSNLTDGDVADIHANGFRIFRFLDDPLTTLNDLSRTMDLFVPASKSVSVPETTALENLRFLANYAHIFMPKRFKQIKIDESMIKSGDILGISRLDGFGPFVSWTTGAHIDQTAMALWIDDELYIVESRMKSGHWPVDGVQKTPWVKWIEHVEKARMNVVLLPLADKFRYRFNVTGAIEEFKSVHGLPYGVHNVIFSWIDTIEDNYPGTITSELIQVVLGNLDKVMPEVADKLWNDALNKRLGTTGLRTSEIVEHALQKDMTFAEVLLIPEKDSWLYDGRRSLSSSALTCTLLKAGGIFTDVDADINCAEFNPFDIYSLKIFGSSFAERPEECVEVDPDLPYCQLVGDYRVYLPNYNTRSIHKNMSENCPSKAPFFIRPPQC